MRSSRKSKKYYNIIKRNSDYCIYCGDFLQDWQKTIDHFEPITIHDTAACCKENMFVACRECNAIKHSKGFDTLEDARIFILSKKIKPSIQCPICGNCFRSLRHNAKYCCAVCRKEARKRAVKARQDRP